MADALQSFEDKELVTYPIDTISKRSGIVIKKISVILEVEKCTLKQ